MYNVGSVWGYHLLHTHLMPRDHLSEANRDDGEALRASGELVNSETFSLGNGSELVFL